MTIDCAENTELIAMGARRTETSNWFSTVLIRIFFWCKNLQIYKGGVALGYAS